VPAEDLPDGQHAAVLDRYVERWAVLLVGEGQHELHVDTDALPPGCTEGACLSLTVVAGTVRSMTLDRAATDAAKGRIDQKLGRIRRRQGGGRFGR
jgi:hypothetical protein